MKYEALSAVAATTLQLASRCPHCGKAATLEPLGQDFAIGNDVVCGQRRCPDPACHGHIFVVVRGGKLIETYPPVRIEFDAENVPDAVRGTMEEALACHAAGALTAATMMVRRALELVCTDRGAEGEDFRARLRDLGSKIVLPKDLMDAMGDFDLLSEEAGRIGSEGLGSTTARELEVAIEFAKEILKAAYHYASLVDKLRGLKSS